MQPGPEHAQGVPGRREVDGTEIDVDLGPTPPLIQFDVWRVRMFAESIGEASVTDQELSQALQELADQGLISRIPSPHAWYTITSQEGDDRRT
ncbi:hypothetical protein ABGB12_05375 [Actinocorallia sp. B10E7]|uniref:DUF6896 domain-containing protein n=1 Tax=Actinocorallia sp. B10E7 TaxID=3153558 RepID=UPI00325C36CD